MANVGNGAGNAGLMTVRRKIMLIATFSLRTRPHHIGARHNHPASVCRIMHARNEVVVGVRADVDVFTSARTMLATRSQRKVLSCG
jgi:hypothetical protein